jgi:hypothetical protein
VPTVPSVFRLTLTERGRQLRPPHLRAAREVTPLRLFVELGPRLRCGRVRALTLRDRCAVLAERGARSFWHRGDRALLPCSRLGLLNVLLGSLALRCVSRLVRARGASAFSLTQVAARSDSEPSPGPYDVMASRPCLARAAPIAVFTSLRSSGGGRTADKPRASIQSSRPQPVEW